MADAKISSFASHGTPVAADYVASVLASGPTSKRLLMSDAQDFVLNAFGGGTEIAVTGAVTATIGRMHHCTGTTSDYDLALPAAAGNAGKLVGVRMGSASALTKLVTLNPNASETIDGATTRVMWATETAILLCDGSNWHKIAGKSIPMTCSIYRDTAQSINNSAFVKVSLVSTYYDPAALADTTTAHKITIGRTGHYAVEATLRVEEGSAIAGYVLVYKNGTEMLRNSVTAIWSNPQLSSAVQLTKSDYLQLYCFHEAAGAEDVSFNASIPCVLTISEFVKW